MIHYVFDLDDTLIIHKNYNQHIRHYNWINKDNELRIIDWGSDFVFSNFENMSNQTGLSVKEIEASVALVMHLLAAVL